MPRRDLPGFLMKSLLILLMRAAVRMGPDNGVDLYAAADLASLVS